MKRRTRISGPLYRAVTITLAAVCLAIIALIILVPAPGDNGQSEQTADQGGPSAGASQGPESTSPEGATGMDASSPYRPFPSLESLIASTRQRMEFRVLSPGETVPNGTLVVFRWEDEGGGPWKVTVLDNRGNAIQEEEVKSPDFTLSSPKPGLYYWTVAREDRVLHVGRVKVR